jgi:hypothetical protein
MFHKLLLVMMLVLAAACGDDDAALDGGNAESDSGAPDAALPADLFACDVPSDCKVVPASCCGGCGAPRRGDALAIAGDKLGEHREMVCDDQQACPDCDSLFLDPTLVATCRDARCALVDLLEHAASACESDDECSLRTPDCCPCGGDYSPGRVIAVTSQSAYAELVCDPEQGCDGCLPSYPSEVTAACNAQGHCETEDPRLDPSYVPDSGAPGVGCEVDGVIYPSGSSGIGDPQSCNTCSCIDGALTLCTEIGCPEPCEEGTTFGMECAQCGPGDGCEVVRFGCMPECDAQDDCESGQCIDGVCRILCG